MEIRKVTKSGKSEHYVKFDAADRRKLAAVHEFMAELNAACPDMALSLDDVVNAMDENGRINLAEKTHDG